MQPKISAPFMDLTCAPAAAHIPALNAFIQDRANRQFATVTRTPDFDEASLFFIGPTNLLDESYNEQQRLTFHGWSKIADTPESRAWIMRLQATFKPVALLLKESLRRAFDYKYDYTIAQFQTNTIPPGAMLKPHIDGHREATLAQRVHLVLTTNPGSFMVSGENRRHYDVGDCFIFNNRVLHSVENNGNTDRTHLVIDFIPKN